MKLEAKIAIIERYNKRLNERQRLRQSNWLSSLLRRLF